MFSLFRGVFLSPLPFPEDHRLVTVTERRGGSQNAELPLSGHEVAAWQPQNRVFDRMPLFRPEGLNLTGGGVSRSSAMASGGGDSPADSAIVGQTITLNDRAWSVIGVMPPLPRSLSFDAWVPLDVPGHVRAVGRHNLSTIARLKPGVLVSEAQTDLQIISDRLARELPAQNTDHNPHVMLLRDGLVGEYRTGLLLLLSAVGFVRS